MEVENPLEESSRMFTIPYSYFENIENDVQNSKDTKTQGSVEASKVVKFKIWNMNVEGWGLIIRFRQVGAP